MTISVVSLLVIMFAHWVADFICQSDWMARGKSKDIWILTSHVLLYTVLMGFPLIYVFPGHTGSFGPLLWWVSNGVLHWITDYFTSRASAPLFDKGDYHHGFVVVGADQFIHLLCLVLTTVYFLNF